MSGLRPHDTHSLARIFADSGIDLADDDRLVEHLIGKGIRPTDLKADWAAAKLLALEARAKRPVEAGAACYALALLGAMLVMLQVTPARAEAPELFASVDLAAYAIIAITIVGAVIAHCLPEQRS